MHRRTLPTLLACALPGILNAAPETPEYHRDIRPLIEGKCLACHSEQGVAFSFESANRTYDFRAAIAEAVVQERMPPWLAQEGHQEYRDDFSLTAEERDVFARWQAADFPREADAQLDGTTVPVATRQRFDADLSLEILVGKTYLPDQQRKDDYRCFVVDWPFQTDKYITGFRAEPGNLRIAHHLVLYAAMPQAADAFREFSEHESRDGYQCFGGAVADRLNDDAAREDFEQRHPGGLRSLFDEHFWLAHWAPGVFGYRFPEESGILVRPGSVLIAQMHYYAGYAPGESDRGSTLHFELADTVNKPSAYFPLTHGPWLNGSDNRSMVVPPGESATYETRADFRHIAELLTRIYGTPTEHMAAIELASANVHMHSFGAAGTASLLNPDGRKEILLRIPDWDLNWQHDFMFTRPKRIDAGHFENTELVVECTYENHTAAPVYGGFGSDDEMCFDFSYVSLIADPAASTTAGQ